MMNLHFPSIDLQCYKSQPQRIRVLSEAWVENEMFCPICGCPHLTYYSNNKPVADFYCDNCRQDFELKSKCGNIGKVIPDGAYQTAIQRINSNTNPHLLVMHYNIDSVVDFVVVPKFFFVEKVIQKRQPLSSTARRAGWVGCNILYGDIPMAGKISIIENGIQNEKDSVLNSYKKSELLYVSELDARGWLFDVLSCIEKIQSNTFTLEQVYEFVPYLSALHPDNHNVQPKIRQVLQLLRDKGYLQFIGKGLYKKL